MILIVLVAGLSLMTGCLESQNGTEKQGQPNTLVGSLKATPYPPADLSPAAQKAEIEKWNSYVDLGNEIEIVFQPALAAYFDIFGRSPEYQPAKQLLINPFLTSMSNSDHLTALINIAIEMSVREPRSELDQAVEALAVQLKSLWSGLQEARDLLSPPLAPAQTSVAEIEVQNQTQQPGQVGIKPPPLPDYRQLHKRIYESYQDLMLKYGRFRGILNQVDALRREKDIQDMNQKGMILRAALLQLIDSAQNIQDMLSSRSITSSTMANLDLEEFTNLYNNFQKSIDEFEKKRQDTQQLSREKLEPASLASFIPQLKLVQSSLFSLMTRFQLQATAGTVPSVPEGSIGTPEHFGRELGSLVDQYNTITH